MNPEIFLLNVQQLLVDIEKRIKEVESVDALFV